MHRTWAGLGAVNAFLSVGVGAFGAHALKASLTPELLAIFETGARYHFFHALGLFAVAFLAKDGLEVDLAGALMLLGILLFSGSLYALALTGIRELGMVTPFGGVAFLAAWALLAYRAFRSP